MDDKGLKQRKRLRLKEYDYSSEGMYSVTICVENRRCVFGKIVNNKMKLNDIGNMIEKNWNELLRRFSNVKLDEFVIMPNHLHGIINIVGASLVDARDEYAGIANEWAGTRDAPTKITLGGIVGAFKSITTNEYIQGVHQYNWPVFNGKLWQRGFYEHVVRNDNDLNRIRQYTRDNPINWQTDLENYTNEKRREYVKNIDY